MDLNNNASKSACTGLGNRTLPEVTSTFTTLKTFPRAACISEFASTRVNSTSADFEELGTENSLTLDTDVSDSDGSSESFDRLDDDVGHDTAEDSRPTVVLEVQGDFYSGVSCVSSGYTTYASNHVLQTNDLQQLNKKLLGASQEQSLAEDGVMCSFSQSAKGSLSVAESEVFEIEAGFLNSSSSSKRYKNSVEGSENLAKLPRLQLNSSTALKPHSSTFVPQKAPLEASSIFWPSGSLEMIPEQSENRYLETSLPSTWEPTVHTEVGIPRPLINPTDDVWVACKADSEWDKNQPHQTLMIPASEYANQHMWRMPHLESYQEQSNSSVFLSCTPQSVETIAEELPRRRCSSGYSSEMSNEIRNVPYSIGRKDQIRSAVPSGESSSVQHKFKDANTATPNAPFHFPPKYPSNNEPWIKLPVNGLAYRPSPYPAAQLFANSAPLQFPNTQKDVIYRPDFISQKYSSLSVFSQCPCAKKACDLKEPMTYEIFVKLLPDNISPNDVFCMVPGRLGMPNQGKKHVVAVGEILRRVLAPESLNISLLGPILRKAKSKNGSRFLRQKLHQIGVELPQGRRKTAQCTLFTSLTESEANQLAADYSKLCECNFPAKSLARRNKQPGVIAASPQVYQDTLKLINQFTDSLSNLTISSNEGEKGADGMEEASKQLYNFETLTHGFGTPAILSSLNVFRTYINDLAQLSKPDA